LSIEGIDDIDLGLPFMVELPDLAQGGVGPVPRLETAQALKTITAMGIIADFPGPGGKEGLLHLLGHLDRGIGGELLYRPAAGDQDLGIPDLKDLTDFGVHPPDAVVQ